MKNLNERGLTPLLNHLVMEKKTPVLGLCLGMQLLSQYSDEGQLPGLGWIEAETIRFKFDKAQTQLKIPHMGWNTLDVSRPHPLIADLDADSRFHFFHSHHVICTRPETNLAWTEYGYTFASVISKENIIGVQFHLEKSHKHGMRLLKNYAGSNGLHRFSKMRQYWLKIFEQRPSQYASTGL